jgi:class 3 adenylate cyclase
MIGHEPSDLPSNQQPLGFSDPKLEMAFQDEITTRFVENIRVRFRSIMVAIVLFGLGLFFYDEFLRPFAYVTWAMVPYSIVFVRALLSRVDAKAFDQRGVAITDFIMVVGFLVYAVVISSLLVVDLGLPEEAQLTYQLVPLILVAGHVVNAYGAGRFIPGLLMAGTSILAYLVFACFSDLGAEQVILHLLLLCMVNFGGGLNAYQQEQMARRNFLMKRAVDAANVKAEKLLLNILPGSIAARLKETPETIAESFADSTVLFADIVGFTVLSQKVTATKLVEMLNVLFSRFDDLTEKHGLEKIKTIGDAYMAAAGLPEATSNHAQVIADMALDMRLVMKDFTESAGEPLEIRIGINSGPVVAGVIGKKKFIYDLWGDAVNTAARMESHGIPGEIQVSQSTWELLKDDYELESRGPISVKGKGSMSVWLLKGAKS